MRAMRADNQKMADQETAIFLAGTELLKHYPNYERSGSRLNLAEAKEIKGQEGKWFIRYGNPEGELDSGVEMIVDIKNKEVLNYRDSWS